MGAMEAEGARATTRAPQPHYYIGGLAKLTGFTVHAIRWYEAQGLIPGVERDRGGRRVYLQGHVDHLAFIERLRRTGMTIAELKRLSDLGAQGWRTLRERQAMLEAHRAHVEQEIVELRRSLKLIDEKIAWYAEWEARKKRPPPLPPQRRTKRARR
ncbi:MAG: MerR family transcriptional regulator [Hyphomonadaceae bacterium]